MIRGLFPEEWYNNDAFSDDELGFVLHDNKLLGLPRLRMLMVGNDTCQVHSDFDGEISECFAPYSKGVFADALPPSISCAWGLVCNLHPSFSPSRSRVCKPRLGAAQPHRAVWGDQ